MSGRIISQIYDRVLDHPAQTVLVAMADHADDMGNECYPSVPLIAWKTGYGERQVQRIIAGLRSAGALVVVKPATARHSTEYRIDVNALPMKPPFAPDRLTAKLRDAVIAVFAPVCQYCRTEGTRDIGPDGRAWEVDRVIPASEGGRYEAGNITLSCSTCNKRRKGSGATTMAPLAIFEGCHPGRPGVPSGPFRGAIQAGQGCHLDHLGVPSRPARGAIAATPEPPYGTEDRNHGDAGASPGIEASAESAALLDAAPASESASAPLSPAEREAAWRERWGMACTLFADSLTGNPDAWMGERGKPLALYRNLIGTVGRHVDGDPVKVVAAWRKFESEMRSTVMNDGRPLWSIISTANVVERIGRWLKEDGGRPRRPLNLDQPNGPMDDILRRLPPRRGPLNLDQPYTEYDEMVRNPHYRRLVQREGGN